MIWKHSKNDNSIISLEMRLDAPGHETISSSNGLFWQSAFVKSWIRSTIHCIQLLNYSRNIVD